MSDTSSKIVKIMAARAVYAGQRPAALVVSARIQHAPTEMNVGFGSARVRFRSWYERTPRRLVSLATASLAYSAAGPSEVYFRVDLQVSRCRPGHRFGQRRGRAARGPDAHLSPRTPGWPMSRRHGGVTGRTGRGVSGPTGPGRLHNRHDAVVREAPASRRYDVGP
jgi:hypothetical protein